MSINWDEIAELYAEQRPHSYGAMIEEPVVSRMLENVKGKIVLDAGCAGGYFSGKLHDVGAEVVGIDISQRMLNYGKKNKNVSFVRADVNYLPFPKRSFDVVLASLLFNNVWNYENAIKEIKRVLKENGDFVFSVEHPILTSGSYIYKIYPVIKDYFTQRLVNREWVFGDKTVIWKTIHRPISSYLNPLFKNGFKIIEIAEPSPPKELKEMNSEMYKKRKIAPVFLIIHAKG